jgi:Fe-S-cluster containining protein
MRAVLRGERDAQVPCDGCVGCCVSAYPVPLRPADGAALERVPARYLALQAEGGMARMNPREDGTCPMLEAGKCHIYLRRPQTCRDYDCRIYTAAGLVPDGERPVIRERVLEWRFGFADERARQAADAVRRAAAFIVKNAAEFPAAVRAHSATAAAVLAIKTYASFIDAAGAASPQQRAREVLRAAAEFEAGR